MAYADGTALADADPAAGHQVYLGDGLNTVRVTVSAQRKTPRVYTVHVRRGVPDAYEWKAEYDFTTPYAAGNRSPWGLWSNGTTMWVLDYADDRLYAYDLDTKERDSGRDFDTLAAAGNKEPRGIWSDGETMWVADYVDYVDYDDGKLYAYDMATKGRVSGRDFTTLAAAGNHIPGGLWSDGETMWVADSGDDKLYAYNMPAAATEPGPPPTPAVTPGDTTLVVACSAPVNNGGSDISAYDVRHILSSAGDKTNVNWTVVYKAWSFGGGALSAEITGLSNASEYDVQVRVDSGRGQDRTLRGKAPVECTIDGWS